MGLTIKVERADEFGGLALVRITGEIRVSAENAHAIAKDIEACGKRADEINERDAAEAVAQMRMESGRPARDARLARAGKARGNNKRRCEPNGGANDGHSREGRRGLRLVRAGGAT
jgi:hypothetical protein